MSDVVIRVENISKLYRLGEVGTGSLAHDVNRWWHRVRGKEDPYLKIGEVNDRTKPAKQARTDGGPLRTNRTTKDTNSHENLTTEDTESTEVGAGGNQRSDSAEFLEGHSQAGLQMDSESVKFDSLDPSRLAPAGLPSAVSRAAAQPPGCGKKSSSALVSAPKAQAPSDWVYALKDVSFEVKRGEVLGIIGRNGAGKSTLLKILSRVTTQTTGSIKVKGRIASLLEVGTGFHPELTGRENIFLNGAILGMRKTEIARKFDEIVEFSGCARYIDTPVKRYSSGMYVRLAFAVAAHLEPEILIVDEVLAVGDAEFQKKCLGKMKDVAGHGRTILFVSHNMTSLQALCDRAIFLENGKALNSGSVHDAVALYLHGQVKEDSPVYDVIEFPKNADAVIDRVRILDSEGQPRLRFRTSEPWFIEIQWRNLAGIPVNPNIQLKTNTDVTALIALDASLDWDGKKKAAPGSYVSTVTMPAHFLNGNEYKLSVALDSGSPRKYHHGATDCITIKLWDPMDETSLARGFFSTPREDAIVWPVLDWKCTGPRGQIN